MSTTSQKIRHRYLADRILFILLYHPPAVFLERAADGSITLKVSKLAKQLRMNSAGVYDQLNYLNSMGYLDKFDRSEWGVLTVRPVKPLVVWS